MRIEIQDAYGFYRDNVGKFGETCRSAGIVPEVYVPPSAPVQLAGPATSIIVQIDPETLKLIFGYVAALLATHKATNYAWAFFESAVKGVGETAGKKISEGLVSLWETVCRRIKEVHSDKQHTRVYLYYEGAISGVPFEAGGLITPDYLSAMSEDQFLTFRQQLSRVLLYRVFPTIEELIAQCSANGVSLKNVKAILAPKQNLTSEWHIEAYPMAEFIMDQEGVLRPRYSLEGFRWHPFKVRRFKIKGIKQSDLKEIALRFKAATRTT